MAGVQQNLGPGGVLTMNEPKFKNWLKAAYAFKYLKSGLENFVSTQVGQRYCEIKAKVCQQCSVLKHKVCQHVQLCSVCTSNNLLPDHTAKGCKRRDCFCTKRPRTRRKCPNNFCSVFYDLIVDDHIYNTPRWSSTDISVWDHDFIQYVKCFLGTHLPAKSFNEIDCTGILSIVINNQYIRHSINNVRLFEKCRENRNAIFHTGNYQVTDQEVNAYIDDMIHVLEDRNSLINDHTAKAGVATLIKLRNGQITITDVDIVRFRQDSLVAINELSDEVKQEIEDKRKQVLKDFNQRYAGAIQEIQNLKDEAIGKIDEHKDDAVHDASRQISEQTDDAICKIQQASTNAGISSEVKRCHACTNDNEPQIKRQKVVGISSEDIRETLVKIYKNECGMLPVLPVGYKNEMELLSIYQPPSLCHVPYDRAQDKEGKYPKHGPKLQEKEKKCPISSYKDIFCKDEHWFKKIYITGDAGFGKTSFCKRMSLLWCKSQSGEHVSDTCVQRDIDFMSQFDFAFHISLGKTHRKDVVAMLVEQLFYSENSQKQDEMYKSIKNIISRNKCVIIMDAMDEWTPRESGEININRLFLDKCTFIITCRPYKLDNMEDSDRHVKMLGISDKSTKQYIEKVVQRINRATGKNKKSDDFMHDAMKFNLDEQLRIPIIASHLIIVWFENKLTDMSRALLYSNIVDMLLKWAEKKPFEFPISEESTEPIPDSLPKLFYLTKHRAFMKKIGLLSFNVLFKQYQCLSDLVFTEEQLASNPYNISGEEIDFLCKFGILSKHEVIGRLGKREQKLSYLHKTYLEFFAALFVASFDSNNAFDDVVKKWNTVDDVLSFETFLCFYVGFSCEKSKTVFDDIYHSISDDLNMHRRNATHARDDWYFNPGIEELQSLQRMVLNCFKIVRQVNNPNMSCKLEDFIFDSSNLDLLKQLLLLNRTSVKALYSMDHEYHEEFDKIQGLEYLFVYDPGQSAQLFENCIIQNKATLHTCSYKGIGYCVMMPKFDVSSFQQLTSLSLQTCFFQHERLLNLVEYLSNNVRMEYISLSLIRCNDHRWLSDSDDCTPTLYLQQHTKLTSLELDRVDILCNSVNTSSLKTVKLHDMSAMSADGYRDLLNSIGDSQVEHLSIGKCPCYTRIDTLTDVVKTLPCIKSLTLRHIDLTYDFSLQLHPDVTQLKIWLYKVTLSRQWFQSFIDSIVNIKSVREVELEYCQITTVEEEVKMSEDESLMYMSEYLKTNHPTDIDIIDNINRCIAFKKV